MFQVIILIADKDLSSERFEELLSFVPPEKRVRIKRFTSYRDAQNCLLGDVLARSAICRVTGLKNEELEFEINEHGKPFLRNVDDIHYNISHSEQYIALALDDVPVGIDIERMRTIEDRYEKIAKRFFAKNEIEYIERLGVRSEELRVESNKVSEHINLFFEIWTMKEARIKLEGKGLSMPLTSFNVLQSEETERLFYYRVFENDEAVCHVCSFKPEPPGIRVMGIEELTINS